MSTEKQKPDATTQGSSTFSSPLSGTVNPLYSQSLIGTSGNQPKSLLLNQANLAWSQPAGCVLVAPRPPPTTTTTTEISTNQPIETTTGVDNVNQSLDSNSLSSSLSTLNNSDYGKVSSISSTLEELNVSDTMENQTNLDNLSNQAVTGSNESLIPRENAPTSATAQQQPEDTEFKEIEYHWYYQKDSENSEIWQPFSLYDNYNLEYAYQQGVPDAIIPTNGTRFDVCIKDRTRSPVYWSGPATRVQRCSWFYKRDSDYRFVPYSEDVANVLETSYRECFFSKTWNRRIDLSNTEFVYFYSYNSVYHYISDADPNADGWGAMMETHYQPRYAYRGVWLTNSNFEHGESQPIDHVVFIVHGIGEFCDMSFRKLVDVVDDFREITSELVNTHYGHENVGRVEVLPISWHRALHTDQLDSHLSNITLSSIPRMRSFTNDTIMDALFYTSASHSQTILNSVASELNRLYAVFLARNPSFQGSVALGGHSLGSLILFDLLSHQAKYPTEPNATQYPLEQINFHPICLFGLGSPIPVFLAIRGIEYLDPDFHLPTCRAFYNIFHPYDPIAYRFEPLINSELTKLKPVLIPHHKGRKRLHYVVRDSIAKMGTDLKQRFFTSIKSTLNSIYDFALAHKSNEEGASGNDSTQPQQQQQQQEDPLLTAQATESPVHPPPAAESPTLPTQPMPDYTVKSGQQQFGSTEETDDSAMIISSMNFGKLNSGRRIDFVLQERPIEVFNEYLFAIAAHGCYWLSEDTSLLMLRELYGQMGVLSQFHETLNATELAESPNLSSQQQQALNLPSDVNESLIPVKELQQKDHIESSLPEVDENFTLVVDQQTPNNKLNVI